MRKQLLLASAVALSAGLCWRPVLSWTYQNETDMHGTANYASVTSDNSETLSFPYHGGPARLWIRKHPKYGTDVYINVPDGQIICDSYDGCSVPVKFDDGKVERFTGGGPADLSSTTVFIRNASRFIAKAKKAKTVIIELTFYQDGDHQYTFSVEGLQWKQADAKPKPKDESVETKTAVETPRGPVDDAYINDLIARLKKRSN